MLMLFVIMLLVNFSFIGMLVIEEIKDSKRYKNYKFDAVNFFKTIGINLFLMVAFIVVIIEML